MKRIFVAWLGLLAFAVASATAADLPRYQPVAPIYNPIYNWTGFYIGINGGGGWGSPSGTGINKFDVSGGMIGGTIGYNWQIGQIVVGAEGDIDWSGVKGNTTALCAAGCETRNNWLATLRGRLGYAFDRFLPYITAGLARRRHQRDPAGLSRRQRQQCRLDRRRWSRIRHRQQCEHQSRISLCGSRRLQLRVQLRSRGQRQRVLRRQRLSRRSQHPVLITTACETRPSPGSRSGAFLSLATTRRAMPACATPTQPGGLVAAKAGTRAANSSSHATRRG